MIIRIDETLHGDALSLRTMHPNGERMPPDLQHLIKMKQQ
jgi:hypothetical protein